MLYCYILWREGHFYFYGAVDDKGKQHVDMKPPLERLSPMRPKLLLKWVVLDYYIIDI